jgi:CBS domain-containing protein
MKVSKAMHKGVTWVEPDTPVDTLAIMMREHDIGAIPVGENDRLIGMVTDRDIVCRCLAAGLDPRAATARDVMTKGIRFCLDKHNLNDAARLMEIKKVRRLPVINGKKRMVGMLSLGDVYHKAHDASAAQSCMRSQHTTTRREWPGRRPKGVMSRQPARTVGRAQGHAACSPWRTRLPQVEGIALAFRCPRPARHYPIARFQSGGWPKPKCSQGDVQPTLLYPSCKARRGSPRLISGAQHPGEINDTTGGCRAGP